MGRKENEDELDRLIGEWTFRHTADEVVNRLQEAGVAAGIVDHGDERTNDPQLRYRGHFVVLDHPEIGPHYYENMSWRLSKTPAEPGRPSPCLGEHTEYVAKQILRMSDEEFVELFNAGVFE